MYIESREINVVIFLIISLVFLFIGIKILAKWKLLNKKKTVVGIILTTLGLSSAYLAYLNSGINDIKKITQDIEIVSKVEKINFKKDLISLKNLKEYFESLYGEHYVVHESSGSTSNTINKLTVTLQNISFIIQLHENEDIAKNEFDKMYSKVKKNYIQKDSSTVNKRYCISYKYKTWYRNFPWNSKVMYNSKNMTFELMDTSLPDKIASQDTIKILDALIQEAEGIT